MNYSLVDSLMEEFDQKSSMKIPEDIRARVNASLETQGQLVGTTGFSWAKAYNKNTGSRGAKFEQNV